ncbi:PREDICTED: homeobox protein Hox-B6-like, partial [Fulmarus glacialis]|uniref:homeobox protein Hox-B6-like n=1 Tax=Fulmarus glacialis TaxID=30455 RepID=UPI00051B599A
MSSYFVNSTFPVSLAAGQEPCSTRKASGAYSRSSACDYGAGGFFREKDPACAPPTLDEVPFAPEPRKSDCAQSKTVFGESEEQKCSAPVYPWMQRMNSCN